MCPMEILYAVGIKKKHLTLNFKILSVPISFLIFIMYVIRISTKIILMSAAPPISLEDVISRFFFVK